MNAALRLVGAAVAGIALDAAFPGLGWWPLAPVSLAMLFLLLRGQPVALGALVGMVFGLAFFVPHLSWSGIYVGPVPWLALACLQALYVGAFGAVVTLAGRWVGTSWAQVLLCVPLWVAQEAVRARTPFGGFPWGRVAFSQADGPAVGWAWVGGAPMVTFVIATAGALTALAALRLRSAGLGRSQGAWRPVALLAAAAVLPLAGDPLRTAGQEPPQDQVTVAAVQGNVARPGLDFNAERREVLGNHVKGTLALAEDVRRGRLPAPDVVLWPENSSDIDPTRDSQAATEITLAAAAVGVPVVVGAVLSEPAPNVSNSTLVWSPTGQVTARYDKHRPVPFAEYVPYRSFFRTFSTAVDLVRTDFAAGSGPNIVQAGPVRLGVAICFEVAFDDQLRTAVRQGAQVLFVPTNNATFGRTDESVQQLAMSRLRAVELGRPVAHVSTVGVSALIRPDGSFVGKGGHFTSEVLSASLPLSTSSTPALRLGPALELAIVAAGFAIPALMAIRRARRPDGRRAQPAGSRTARWGHLSLVKPRRGSDHPASAAARRPGLSRRDESGAEPRTT
ncbi:apolipoprotein N-acyltransferase [Ornithinibacter aureus]|uniref:Apolipoprotein N-acyltransferase n=1 Tax=Ornithinibacter aureus TaxID=622664 RepID=A0ABP8K4V3_9MICO|nr:apolipoprotein N-acyltransferase [Ornithinibacter aureus]KAF0834837.1 apolipoprotein N-acyltransferase [Ornithinibacter aureus]